jgi:hypothetical protein
MTTLVLCPGPSLWHDLGAYVAEAPVDEARLLVGVNHVLCTNMPLQHAVMGDGQWLEGFLAVSTRPRPVTHSIPGKPADFTHEPHDREGGSGMLAVQVALGLNDDKVLLLGCDLAGGYFYDPTRREPHDHLQQIWARNLDWMRGRVTAQSGWLREMLLTS